jgi:choline kinase
VTVVENPRWRETGTSVSLLIGLRALPPRLERVLVVEGDVVYEPGVLWPLLAAGAPGATLVTSYEPGLQGSMVTCSQSGAVETWTHADERPPGPPSADAAKTVNLTVVDAAFVRDALLPAAEDVVLATHGRASLERVMAGALARADTPLLAVVAQRDQWVEVDDAEDLAAARARFSAATAA